MTTDPKAARGSDPLYLTNIDEAAAFGFQVVEGLVASANPEKELSAAIVFPAAPPTDSVVLPLPGVRHQDGVKRLLEGDLRAMVQAVGPPIVLFIAPASKVEPSSNPEETRRPAFDVVALDVMHANEHRRYFAEVGWRHGQAANDLYWREAVGPNVPLVDDPSAIQSSEPDR